MRTSVQAQCVISSARAKAGQCLRSDVVLVAMMVTCLDPLHLVPVPSCAAVCHAVPERIRDFAYVFTVEEGTLS